MSLAELIGLKDPLLHVFIYAFGIAGSVLGVILYLPQIFKSIQTKSTKDLAMGTYTCIFVNDALWTGYGLLSDNPIIYYSNGIGFGLCMVILLLKKRYG